MASFAERTETDSSADVGSRRACEAAHFTEADVTRRGAGGLAFRSLVGRHVGDPSVVDR